jgi:eight-cysteine-cluster-containing protein
MFKAVSVLALLMVAVLGLLVSGCGGMEEQSMTHSPFKMESGEPTDPQAVPDWQCSYLDKTLCLLRPDCKWKTYPCLIPPCPGSCVMNTPTCYVGGCSGQVCSDKKDVITTCEWMPYYACYKLTTCGNHGVMGSCAWKKTPQFIACMIENGGPL